MNAYDVERCRLCIGCCVLFLCSGYWHQETVDLWNISVLLSCIYAARTGWSADSQYRCPYSRQERIKCGSANCEHAKVIMYRLWKSKNAENSAEVCVKCESYVRNTWHFKRIQAHVPTVNRPSSSIVLCRCNHRCKKMFYMFFYYCHTFCFQGFYFSKTLTKIQLESN